MADAEKQYIVNPKTKRMIAVNGKSFQLLLHEGYRYENGKLVTGDTAEEEKVVLVLTKSEFERLNKIYSSYCKNTTEARERYQKMKKTMTSEKTRIASLDAFLTGQDPLEMKEVARSIDSLTEVKNE